MTILAGALLALPALPAVAHAAEPPFVLWAQSVEDDLGTLEVAAFSDAGITELRAHIVSSATGQDVGVVDNFELVDGTVQSGRWRTATPVQLDELNFYQVDIEAFDSEGQREFAAGVGTFSYLVRTAFSPLRAQPATVTYARRSVRISGTLSGTWPGNRQVRPIDGAAVSVRGGTDLVAATTAADGSFVATIDVAGPDTVDATFSDDPNRSYLLRAVSDRVPVAVAPTTTFLTAKASPARVEAGESVTLSGRLTRRSPDGRQPLADQQLGVLFCTAPDRCPTSVAFPRTDADGRYQLTVTPWETGFYQVGFPSRDPFLGNAVATDDIVVLQLAEFADFTAARDASGAVVTSGHLRFGPFTPSPIPVEIQFKPAGATSWTTVATVPDARSDGRGYAFSATTAEPGPGRWRAFYAGRPDFYQSAVSTVIRVP